MNELTTMVILAAILLLYVTDKLLNHVEKQKMQNTISELSSKVMARDFREYVSMSKPPEPDRPKREPMSWHDDPNIDDDAVN